MADAEAAGAPASLAGKYTVQSVARALTVLDFLATGSDSGCSVTEVGEATGLSKSAAFAVLQTLLSAGYVADSGTGPNRRYRLGRALTRLGDRAREQSPIRELARPTLQRLATSLGLSVRLGVLQGARAAIIDRVDSIGGMRIDLRMGDRELLHCTAVGKAILSGCSSGEVRDILRDEPLIRRTRNTITDLQEFLEHLKTVRVQGFAVDDEEDFDGITCVSAPVRDHTSQVVAAISVTAVKAGLGRHRVDEIGTVLSDGAGEVSASLGYIHEAQ